MPLRLENQNTEFKQSWRDDWLKTICAFANTQGGKLYVGVDDAGNIVGVENIKKLLVDVPNKINNRLGIIPVVSEGREDNLEYLEIVIEQSTVAITEDGKYYIRSGSTTRELNGTALSDFIQRKLGRTWDGISTISYNKDLINEETVLKFKNRAIERIPSIGAEENNKDVLDKLNLIENNNIKNAGVLLFYKNPQAVFLQSKIKIGKFLNDADVEVQDIVDKNLLDQAVNSIGILTTKYLRRYVKYSENKIERKDELEYPIEALREAIYNAIVHRDYTSTVEISIRVYDDKLVIMNPGILPPEINIASLKKTHTSRPRNPFIADVFQKAGYIEAWGRGTNKIVQVCLNTGLPEPQFSNEDNIFTVTLFKDKLTENALLELSLNNRQIKAVMYVKSNKHITNKVYRELNGVSDETARIELHDLVEKNIFTTRGKGRSHSYILA